MPDKLAQFLAGGGIPDARGAPCAGGDDGPAVRTVRRRADNAAVRIARQCHAVGGGERNGILQSTVRIGRDVVVGAPGGLYGVDCEQQRHRRVIRLQGKPILRVHGQLIGLRSMGGALRGGSIGFGGGALLVRFAGAGDRGLLLFHGFGGANLRRRHWPGWRCTPHFAH